LSAQGPNAPEAAAFEPVDATDMVNLNTGDFSYVIPLLNVPSPEGGYPISLSYHAGIAMDQEASWVGLGWSLNPGTINRAVNGIPDDWKNGLVREFAYDEGGEEYSKSISIGYGVPGKFSAGVGVSYGSNQSLAGSVSLSIAGVYGSIGHNGISAGFGLSNSLGVGASVGFNGSVGASVNFGLGQDSNSSLSLGVGYGPGGFNGSVGISGSQKEINQTGNTTNISSSSVGISFSSSGIGISGNANGFGTSAFSSFNGSVSASDYNVTSKSSSFALVTPWGYFSYGKNETKWELNKTEWQTVKGTLYMHSNSAAWPQPIGIYNTTKSITDVYQINTEERFEQSTYDVYRYTNNSLFPNYDNYAVTGQGIGGSMRPIKANKTPLRVTEGIEYFNTSDTGLYLEIRSHGYNLLYNSNKSINFDFNSFQNSYLNVLPDTMTYNSINGVVFNPPTNSTLPEHLTMNSDSEYIYLNNSFDEVKHRFRKGRNVEYFTVNDINSGDASDLGYLGEANNYQLNLESCGFSSPTEGSIKDNFENSIGAYRITLADGKTYHYSLPVYQIEKIRRLYGIVENKSENQAHMDRMQINPYATHWLLTAITGPDYLKMNNNRNYPDEGDYGYWVRFDYGRWSDGFIWKNPGYNNYSDNVDVFGKVKEYTWGRKQLFYLDKIKTRTHTAIFYKKLRQDHKSQPIEYKNLGHHKIPSMTPVNIWRRPPTLGLSKIMLFKNEDSSILDKTIGEPIDNMIERTFSYDLTGYNEGVNFRGWITDTNSSMQFKVNRYDQVFDIADLEEQDLSNKALKVIDFGYSNNPHTTFSIPNTGTVSSAPSGEHILNSVSFKGKADAFSSPPMRFDYNPRPDGRNQDFKGDFGYHKSNPEWGSLNKITTPTGGHIDINYEPDSYTTIAIDNGKVFTSKLKFTFLTIPPPVYESSPENAPLGITRIKIEIDNQDNTADNINFADHFDVNAPFFMDMWYSAIFNFDGNGWDRSTVNIEGKWATIVELNTSQNYLIVDVEASSPHSRGYFQHSAEPVSVLYPGGDYTGQENQNLPRYQAAWVGDGDGYRYSMRHTIIGNKIVSSNSSGVRVKELIVDDGSGNTYKTTYDYANPNTLVSSGVLPYYPEPNYAINQQAPYISLLPGPVVTYEYVTESNEQTNRQYHFKVLETMDSTTESGVITFGDLLKLKCISEDGPTLVNGQYEVNLKYIDITNNIQSLGRLESSKVYNVKNQLISKTENNYSNVDNEFSLGQFTESYSSRKLVSDWPKLIFKDYGNVSKKTDQYNRLESTTTTVGNYVSTTYFTKYDFITDQVLETVTEDSKGKRFKTDLIPAYTIPEYNPSTGYGMGLKVDDYSNKNMLTQKAMNKTYMEVDGEWELTGVGISTWNNNWSYINANRSVSIPIVAEAKIWRKHKSFVWDGDLNANGTYQDFIGMSDDFNWDLAEVNSESVQDNEDWKNISTTTQYDHFSMPQEIRDLNNNYASTKMDKDDEKVISTANAAYSEQFYSGAEKGASGWSGGQVNISQTNSNYVHTGTFSESATSGSENFKCYPLPKLHPSQTSKKFRISVWVHKTSGGSVNVYQNARLFNGSNLEPFNGETIFAGNWVQLNHYLDLSSETQIYVTTDNGYLFFDDFRLYPIASSMTSYVYDEWGEVSYILGVNNLGTRYEYDSGGRLIKTYSEVLDQGSITGGFKVTKEYGYNY
jgi:hypothetical protein